MADSTTDKPARAGIPAYKTDTLMDAVQRLTLYRRLHIALALGDDEAASSTVDELEEWGCLLRRAYGMAQDTILSQLDRMTPQQHSECAKRCGATIRQLEGARVAFGADLLTKNQKTEKPRRATARP